MVVNKVETDQYYKYGIYVTKTLAVTHPEIYLKADGLFVEIGRHIGKEEFTVIWNELLSILFFCLPHLSRVHRGGTFLGYHRICQQLG